MRASFNLLSKITTLSVFVISLASCGSATTTTSTETATTTGVTSSSSTSASLSYPSGMAVASPTASSSGNSSVSQFLYAETVSAESSYAEKAESFATVIAAASDEACQITLPDLSASSVNPSCYGPQVIYENHPDGPDGSPAPGGSLPALPTGDLGIWTSTNSGSSEACVASKINNLIESTAVNADYTMLLAASMVCLMSRASTPLPSVDGTSVTLTSDLNTAVQVNNSDVTVTLATIENLTDVTDDGTTRDAYKFSITTENSGGASTITATSYMKHMPTASDNSTYKGRIWTEIDGASMAGDKDAVSLTYELASATDMKYSMRSANYQSASSSTVIFDSLGNIAVDGDWSGNMAQGIINIDPATGLGDFSYGWSAGTGSPGSPEEARIFNGYTTSTGGCGFFGYGLGFDNSTGTPSDNVIDGFICNWAGPGNTHADVLDASPIGTGNLAQKQCMTIDATTGVFEVDSSAEAITYSPTVSCDTSAANITAGFTYDVNLDDAFTGGGEPASPVTNDLVDLTTDTDFSSYTAPSEPSLPTGF